MPHCQNLCLRYICGEFYLDSSTMLLGPVITLTFDLLHRKLCQQSPIIYFEYLCRVSLNSSTKYRNIASLKIDVNEQTTDARTTDGRKHNASADIVGESIRTSGVQAHLYLLCCLLELAEAFSAL